MYLLLGLVICAFIPAVLYCIPLDREVGVYMTSKDDVGQKDNELDIGYDRSKPNPEELGGYFEGDIVLPREMDRNGLTSSKYRWPNGVLPYVIKGNYTVNETEVIKKAVELYHKYTCLTFREKLPSDKDYISIISSESGCWAPLGRQDGMQQVSLEAPQCLVEVGTVVHELMHVVGFVHEVNRYDRDEYVEINWGNILKGQEHNFKIRREGEINDYG
ncbi:unnamed protein product, partial [Callosobruchus maculatus]